MQEEYYELKIKPSQYYDEFLELATLLINDALEEKEGAIIARSEQSLEDIEFGIKQFALSLNVECETQLSVEKNEDWVKKYKEAIKPVEVGQFYIRPSWDEARDDKINIIIDPALAFGSGHHETTSSCLGLIDSIVKDGDNILDVGCGSGILGIACAKLGATSNICDTDELAVENANENFKSNGVEVANSWVGSASLTNDKFDVVIANIVADVLIFISNDLKKVLKADGTLILSGILDKHIDRVLAKFDNFDVVERINKNEWVSVALKAK